MSNNVETVKHMNTAWKNKDEAGMRASLHPDYNFKGPMMDMDIEGCIEFMKTCPFECKNLNSEMVSEGNKVVHIFDWDVTAPFQANIPMVEILEFEGDKIKNARLYFDTAKFPAEFMKQMEQMKEHVA